MRKEGRRERKGGKECSGTNLDVVSCPDTRHRLANNHSVRKGRPTGLSLEGGARGAVGGCDVGMLVA